MPETTAMTTTNDVNVMTLIDKAVTNNLSPDAMAKLYDLHRQVEADRSRRAFFAAKAKFKQLCPPIAKDRDGLKTKSGAVVSRYATLEHIDSVITPHLVECGLTYDFNTRVDQSGVTVTCIVSHVDGHSSSSDFTAVADGTDLMNKTQKMASAMTYAKRYSLCNALGIVIREEDDDGQAASPPDAPTASDGPTTQARNARITQEQLTALIDEWKRRRMAFELDVDKADFQRFAQEKAGLDPAKAFSPSGWTVAALEKAKSIMAVEMNV